MDLFEAIEKRASVRGLKAVEVPEADLEKILDAGRRAPSGMNLQPFDFIVIRDPDTLQKLAQAQTCIGDVSVAVAIVGHPDQSRWVLEDVGAATENMLLAITALGYATVWIEGTLQRDEAAYKQALGVPEESRLLVVLPLGTADQPVEQAAKRPLEDLVHWERWGNQHG